MWEIDYSYIESWLDTLDEETVANIGASLEKLEHIGPALGRPLVDTLKGSKIKNLKELRPITSRPNEIRILFVFDPHRSAILLLGGDKAEGKSIRNKWAGWYKKTIPQAEKIYYEHLKKLGINDV